jgi:hypothetical protein
VTERQQKKCNKSCREELPIFLNRIEKKYCNKKVCPIWIIKDVLALERNLAATKQYKGD